MGFWFRTPVFFAIALIYTVLEFRPNVKGVWRRFKNDKVIKINRLYASLEYSLVYGRGLRGFFISILAITLGVSFALFLTKAALFLVPPLIPLWVIGWVLYLWSVDLSIRLNELGDFHDTKLRRRNTVFLLVWLAAEIVIGILIFGWR